MIFRFIDYRYIDIITFISLIAAFLTTCIIIKSCQGMLPRDQGRAFAINGKISQGKPRGAGILFILVFSLFSLIFVPYSNEFLIYIILVIASMVSGYLDDSSKSPWGEYKKGLIDLIIALAAAFTYVNYNGTTINFGYTDAGITIPVWLFIILAVILIWVSINVTNCTDGVDGLSGTLSLITLATMYGICSIKGTDSAFMHMILLFAVCVLAYLWFNASPSRLLMGDAGSRAIGFFIAICTLKTGSPLLYIPAAIVIILDGGLGLVNVFLLRFLKIKISYLGAIPYDQYINKAVMKQKPVSIAYPSASASKSFQAISTRLAKNETAQVGHAKGVARFFSRVFSSNKRV